MFGFLLRGKKKDAPQSGGGAKYWAFATVAIVSVLVGAFLVMRGMDKVGDVASSAVDKTVQAFQPKITIKTVISSAIGKIQKQSKLVVMMTTLDVTIEKSSTKRVAWDVLNLGTTTVAFKAYKNKVQYVVQTDELSPESVVWDEPGKTITITVPPPILDESIVEVQSDPDQCEIKTDIGWARFKNRSGKELEHQIRKELRPNVISAGKHELLLDEAKRKASEVIEALFGNVLKESEMADGVKVNVTFKE